MRRAMKEPEVEASELEGGTDDRGLPPGTRQRRGLRGPPNRLSLPPRSARSDRFDSRHSVPCSRGSQADRLVEDTEELREAYADHGQYRAK
jgi:hypothetical protein